MNRLALGALALVGTTVLAACDQQANEHPILAAIASQPPVSQSVTMPVHASATAQLSGCNSASGLAVGLDGQLALQGLGARLTFRNSEKGTSNSTVEAQSDVAVIPAGTAIRVPRQPTQTNVTGTPSIFLQIVDGSDGPMSSEVLLGRCGSSLSTLVSDFTLPATARATVTSCSNSAGPTVRLSGELVVETEVAAKVLLRGGDTQTAATDGTVKVTVLPTRATIDFANQPVRGGVSRDPWIYLQFLSPGGTPIGEEFLIGRCQQSTTA
jgi:hypothetical protein